MHLFCLGKLHVMICLKKQTQNCHKPITGDECGMHNQKAMKNPLKVQILYELSGKTSLDKPAGSQMSQAENQSCFGYSPVIVSP